MGTAARRVDPIVLALLALPSVAACGKTERDTAYDGYVQLRTDSVSARFALAQKLKCREQVEGDCRFRECDPVPPPILLSAGSISVHGMADFGSCQLPFDADSGEYRPCAVQEGLWDPSAGGQLRIEATGDVIPAFSRVVSVPSSATLTEPARDQQLVDAGDEVSKALPRTRDLSVRWTGGGGVVVVSTAGGWPEVYCEVPATREGVDVSRELLQQLDARLRILSVHQGTLDVVELGGAIVHLDASVPLGSYSLGYGE